MRTIFASCPKDEDWKTTGVSTNHVVEMVPDLEVEVVGDKTHRLSYVQAKALCKEIQRYLRTYRMRA